MDFKNIFSRRLPHLILKPIIDFCKRCAWCCLTSKDEKLRSLRHVGFLTYVKMRNFMPV